AMLASQAGYIMAPATLGTDGAATKPVGTGPFIFDSWTHGSSITVKKNPNYWQPGKPHLDAIEFRVITDPNSRANALAAGELDMMTTDQPHTIADYRTKPDVNEIVDHSGDDRTVT